MKTRRTLENASVLDSRFNRGLVTSQLRGLFQYENDNHCLKEVNDIFHAWSMTNPVPDKRPRFFNVKDVLKLEQDLYVLTSAYSQMQHEVREYTVIQMKTNVWVRFGLPVSKPLIARLGGEEVISRIILSSGVHGLIQLVTRIMESIDTYEEKDTLKANVKLLQEIAKGMLLEGMTNVKANG